MQPYRKSISIFVFTYWNAFTAQFLSLREASSLWTKYYLSFLQILYKLYNLIVKSSFLQISSHQIDGLTDAAQLGIPDGSHRRFSERELSPAFWIQIAAIIRTISQVEKSIRGVWDNVE